MDVNEGHVLSLLSGDVSVAALRVCFLVLSIFSLIRRKSRQEEKLLYDFLRLLEYIDVISFSVQYAPLIND